MIQTSSGLLIYNYIDYELKIFLVHPGGPFWKNKPNEGWGIPKGKVEDNESLFETALRETKEETGIDDLVFIPGFRERITYFYRRGKELVFKEVIFYLAETRKRDVVLSYEHEDYVWLCFEDAINRLTYKNSKEVLKKAHRHLMS